MPHDDGFGNQESKARTFDSLRGKERIEEFVSDLVWDARPPVINGSLAPVSLRDVSPSP
jgi:hypothetical protein